MLRLYKQLLQLRRDTPALRTLDLDAVETHADDERRVLVVRRGSGSSEVLLAFNFSDRAQTVDVPLAKRPWKPMIETGATANGGQVTVPPSGFALWSASQSAES